jgi:hypothetical protein
LGRSLGQIAGALVALGWINAAGLRTAKAAPAFEQAGSGQATIAGASAHAPLAEAHTPQSPAAQNDDFERQRSAARGSLIKGLLDLASWCNSKELFLERDHVYARIIELDPDNLDARKGLRYARNPDGSWKDPAPREMKNRNPKALEELPAKRAAAIAPYRDRLLDLVTSAHADAAQRKSAFDEILALDPDDARVHKELDEVKVDGKWMMPETAAGKTRRAELKALVKKSLDEAPAAQSDASVPDEVKLGGAWTSMVHAGGVRVLGTISAEECQHIAHVCAAEGALLDGLLGCKSTYPAAYTLYVFGSPQEKNAFIEKLPNLTLETRAYMASIASVGLASTDNVLLGDADPAKRLDGAVRHTLIHLLRAAYGIDDKHGWVWEGLGIYLTRELVGTRYTWFVSITPDPSQDAQRAGLLMPTSNWMSESLKLLDGPKPPSLAFVAGRALSDMHVEDMLAAYALAAYFVEGRPQEFPDILHQIGTGDATTAEAVQDVLKLSMDDLQTRVTRWLKERR